MRSPGPANVCDQSGPRRAGRFLAGFLALAALLLYGLPGLTESLAWSRDGAPVLTGFTAHLCHWSWDHLVWDLFAFVLLSWLALRLRPTRYAPALLSAAVLIPLEIRLCQPQFDSYRGLSGIDGALFGLILMALWQHASGRARRVAAAAGSLFLIKTLYEQLTGATLFVPPAPDLFLPAPSAHLTGFLCGLAAGWEQTRPASAKTGAASSIENGGVPAEVA
jgi:rhomboid family GlyGly-CTERM serine protease